MRVAIAHEWLVRYAGSERVVEELLRTFPSATLLTTVVDRDQVPAPLRDAMPSFLQRIPGSTSHHEWFLPLMPLAWRLQGRVGSVDAVVSSSHACAKAVRHAEGTPHLCYCHTPMRYAWNYAAERKRFPTAVEPLARVGMAWFRSWDRRTAARVTRFVANSRAVAERIERFYGRVAEVIPPPVRTEFFTPGGERGPEFLYVGRLVSYKRADLVVEAFAGIPEARLIVVGEGHLADQLRVAATPNVQFLGEVGEEELRRLYRSARALVFPVEEDFGISMAEAQACGTPVVSFARGGAADIVENGVTGWLIERQDVEELREVVRRAAAEDLDSAVIAARAQRFSADRFRERMRRSVEEMVADPTQR